MENFKAFSHFVHSSKHSNEVLCFIVQRDIYYMILHELRSFCSCKICIKDYIQLAWICFALEKTGSELVKHLEMAASGRRQSLTASHRSHTCSVPTPLPKPCHTYPIQVSINGNTRTQKSLPQEFTYWIKINWFNLSKTEVYT